MKLLSSKRSGEKYVKRVRRAVRAIESFRNDWFDEGDTTHKSAASTGIVARRGKRVGERYLRYAPVVTEQGQKFRPAVVDKVDGHEETLQLGDNGSVLRYALGSDTPEIIGTAGLRQMAKRLEWLLKQMQRNPADCHIDGYSLRTPHRAN